MKRRIRQNVWGNWNGYTGTRRTESFGTDEMHARYWLQAGKRWDHSNSNVRPILKGDGCLICPAPLGKTDFTISGVVVFNPKRKKKPAGVFKIIS